MEQAYDPTSSGLANGALDTSVVTVVVVISRLAKSAALICNNGTFSMRMPPHPLTSQRLSLDKKHQEQPKVNSRIRFASTLVLSANSFVNECVTVKGMQRGKGKLITGNQTIIFGSTGALSSGWVKFMINGTRRIILKRQNTGLNIYRGNGRHQ